MSFYVTLPSNTFSDTKNTQSNFSTTLKRSISIEGEYEVALTEISIPAKCLVKYGSIEFDSLVDIPYKSKTTKIDLNLENGISLTKIAEPINESILTTCLKNEYTFRYNIFWQTDLNIATQFSIISKNETFFVFLTKNSAEIIDLEECKFGQIFKVAGAIYENYKFKFTNKDKLPVLGKYIFIRVPEKENQSLDDNLELKSEITNLVKDKINNKKIPQFVNINDTLVLKCQDKIKLLGNISMIFSGLNESNYSKDSLLKATNDLSVVNYAAVYTNIIEEQYFGDTLVPLLRCVNLPKTGSDNSVIYFENPIYVRVNKSFLNSINIKIADLQGNLISFKDIFSFLIVTLHFRKRKNEQYPTL